MCVPDALHLYRLRFGFMRTCERRESNRTEDLFGSHSAFTTFLSDWWESPIFQCAIFLPKEIYVESRIFCFPYLEAKLLHHHQEKQKKQQQPQPQHQQQSTSNAHTRHLYTLLRNIIIYHFCRCCFNVFCCSLFCTRCAIEKIVHKIFVHFKIHSYKWFTMLKHLNQLLLFSDHLICSFY